MKPALIVIDIQNDYFPGGAFPLWAPEETLARCQQAIARAHTLNMPVILVQHIANGPAPFFNRGTTGVQLHAEILAAAPNAPVIVKTHADSFINTTLEATLKALDIDQLLICGMMTQNCVTHTAISRQADKYAIRVIADCCTTVSQMIHNIALNALSSRVEVSALDSVLAP